MLIAAGGHGEFAPSGPLACFAKLTRAASPADIAKTVRARARELVKADGVTFVLRDQDDCHYLDEDAIAPLWKGSRFPLQACISGWVMLNEQIGTLLSRISNLAITRRKESASSLSPARQVAGSSRYFRTGYVCKDGGERIGTK